MTSVPILNLAQELEDAGLLWLPEIGDEVAGKPEFQAVSILVDPQGMGPDELREQYLWLPTLEQMVLQLEVRQAVLFHAGLELCEADIFYKAVIQSQSRSIESRANTLRLAVGRGLRELLADTNKVFH